MKFIVDAQLPPGLCRWLEARGHTALHTYDVSRESVTDRIIADYAESDGVIVVSKDDDFVALRLPDRFTLLWLRCGNISNRGLAEWLEERWEEVERRLAEGEGLIELP